MRSIYIVLLFLTFACTWAGCNKAAKEQTTESSNKDTLKKTPSVILTADQVRTSGIALGSFENKELKSVVKSSGYLKVPPQNRADVSTYMGGVVKSILIVEGRYVKKGQVLATLEHPDFTKMQEEYLKTKNNLAYLEKEYNRQKELRQENVNATKVFEQAEANYRTERDRLASLKDQLEKLHISIEDLNEGKIASFVPIKSPLDGYLSKVYVNTGSFVQPSQQLFEVVNTDHIHIDLLVYETDWFKVKEGDKVFVSLPNRNDDKIQGVVFAVGKSFDMTSKTLPIHAEIVNNQKFKLIPGIYVNGAIESEGVETQALPDEAIISKGGKKYIFIKSPSSPSANSTTFEMKEVKTGANENGYTEVVNAVDLKKEGVVVKGAYYLMSEMEREAGE